MPPLSEQLDFLPLQIQIPGGLADSQTISWTQQRHEQPRRHTNEYEYGYEPLSSDWRHRIPDYLFRWLQTLTTKRILHVVIKNFSVKLVCGLSRTRPFVSPSIDKITAVTSGNPPFIVYSLWEFIVQLQFSIFYVFWQIKFFGLVWWSINSLSVNSE